jgi:pimeloyl-ACP methyl ester carboxylesterase
MLSLSKHRDFGPAMLAAVLLLVLILCGSAAAAEPPFPTGLQHDVVFTETAPLAGASELTRRMLRPLAAEAVGEALAKSGKTLNEQSIALADERFVVYVPPAPPGPRGYGLLVFVPPWEEAAMPAGWPKVMDKLGMIYVSAGRSGNGATIFGRRAPLALIAARNIIARYPIDPDRTYIGGFSGGSRVAMRVAMAYPDLFKGAILNAGSDPIGENGSVLPPRDLFDRFVSQSRLVYVTGDEDMVNLNADSDSLSSMSRTCILAVTANISPHAGHKQMDNQALAEAIGQLDHNPPADPAKLAACRATQDAKIEGALSRVRIDLDAGHKDAARSALLEIDRRYGGLAAPVSVDLWRAIAAPGR